MLEWASGPEQPQTLKCNNINCTLMKNKPAIYLPGETWSKLKYHNETWSNLKYQNEKKMLHRDYKSAEVVVLDGKIVDEASSDPFITYWKRWNNKYLENWNSSSIWSKSSIGVYPVHPPIWGPLSLLSELFYSWAVQELVIAGAHMYCVVLYFSALTI